MTTIQHSAPRLYLASRSPRRRELLTQIGVAFDTLFLRSGAREDDEVDETPHPGEAPLVYVQRVACAKAEHGVRLVAQRRLRPQLVLAADTTLEFAGEVIGKPLDAADAVAILHRLSGQTHRVLTAVAVADETRLETVLSVSEVRFAELDEATIRHYVASGEPMDKAGAYGIQGRGALLVEKIHGDFFNVMGLPVEQLGLVLARFGVKLL